MQNQLVLLVVVAGALALFTVSCSAPSPTEPVLGEVKPLNAGDVESAVAYWADDATVKLGGVPPGVPNSYKGKEQVRVWFKELVASHFQIQVEVQKVEADTVTTKTLSWQDMTRQMNIAPLVATEVYVVKNGKIASLTWTITRESLAIVQAAAATIKPAANPVEFVWRITGAPNPFDTPVGVASDTQGDIYVVDKVNSRVQKFDKNGKFLLMWGSPGEGDGQFRLNMPSQGRVAVDTKGNVYALDVNNYRVQKFDSRSRFLTKWGTMGTGEGQFKELTDIAIDKQDNVYVIDIRNPVVQKFDSNGKFLLRWGSEGARDGQFLDAYSVAIDAQGNVLVSDASARLQKLDSNGKFLTKIPLERFGDKSLGLWNVAVDGRGDIYIADHDNNRIVKFDSSGRFLAEWRSRGKGEGQFTGIEDVSVDLEGNVYISDDTNNCVQKFRKLSFRP